MKNFHKYINFGLEFSTVQEALSLRLFAAPFEIYSYNLIQHIILFFQKLVYSFLNFFGLFLSLIVGLL